MKVFDVDTFSLFNLIINYYAIFSIVSFGINSAYFKFVGKVFRLNSKFDIERYNLFFLLYSLIVTLIFSFCFWFFIDIDLLNIFQELNLIIIPILITNFFLSMVNGYFTSLLYFNNRVYEIKLVSLVVLSIKTISFLYFSYFSKSVLVLLINFSLSNLLLSLYFILFRRFYFKLRFFTLIFFTQNFLPLLKFLILIALNMISDTIFKTYSNLYYFQTFPILLIVNQIAIQLLTYYSLLSFSIVDVFSPQIHLKINFPEKINKIFFMTSTFQFIVLFLVFVGFLFWGDLFILLWLGDSYNLVYLFTLSYIGSNLFPLSTNSLIEISRATKFNKYRSIILLIGSFFYVSLITFFGNSFNEILLIYLFSYLLTFSLLHIFLHFKTNFNFIATYINFLKIILFNLPLILILFFLKIYNLFDNFFYAFLIGIIYVTVYGIVNYFAFLKKIINYDK